MPSQIKVDQIAGASGNTVTVPSGQTLDISSATLSLPSTIVTTTGTQTLTNKTIGVSQLTGTLPVANGGTGLTTLGTAGQALKVNSGATGFEFGTAGGILQVKSATKTDTQSINNGSTYEEVTGLSVTLTPSSASNKVLILVQLSVGLGSSGIASALIKRNGTSIGIGDQVGSSRSRVTIGMDNGTGFGDGVMSLHGQFLDAPASTSALTYKVHASMHGTNNDLYINIADASSSSDSTNNFVAISTITAMEIASGVL
jgi:hypothetical protein